MKVIDTLPMGLSTKKKVLVLGLMATTRNSLSFVKRYLTSRDLDIIIHNEVIGTKGRI